jgi:hypothetical protein
MNEDAPYNLSQAAAALRVSKGTVFNWLSNEELFEVDSHGNQRLVSAESVRRKARELGIDLSEQATS